MTSAKAKAKRKRNETLPVGHNQNTRGYTDPRGEVKTVALTLILKPLGVEALASPNYLLSRSYRSGEGRLITEILVEGRGASLLRFWSKDEAPHNGDFGRKKMEHPPFF